jgi:hypothetical protein
LGGKEMGIEVNADQLELVSDRQVFQHEVLKGGLECEAKDGGGKQSLAHGTIGELLGRVQGVVTMRNVHRQELNVLRGVTLDGEVF